MSTLPDHFGIQFSIWMFLYRHPFNIYFPHKYKLVCGKPILSDSLLSLPEPMCSLQLHECKTLFIITESINSSVRTEDCCTALNMWQTETLKTAPLPYTIHIYIYIYSRLLQSSVVHFKAVLILKGQITHT